MSESIARRRHAQTSAADTAHVLRDATAPPLDVAAPDTYPVVVTRSFGGPVSLLPRARRHAFLTHLVRAVREAFASPDVRQEADAVSTTDASMSRLLGQACATCGGFCCRRAGDHAHVAADTVRRYVAAHPGVRPGEVVRAYAAYLHGTTHDGSCVFHHADGCALPTDMRSDPCNRYVCGALAELQRADLRRAFVAAANPDGAIVAAAFTNAGATRAIRVPLPIR